MSKIEFFRAFRHKGFRALWVYSFLAMSVMELDTIARSWLVLILTGSPFLTGIANASRSFAMLLGLVGGIMADRFDRRKVLAFSCTINVVLGIILTVLTATNLIQFWHIIVVSLLVGLLGALTGPAQQTLFVDVVGSQDLMNALGLNRVTTSIMGIITAAIGGIIIDLFGVSSCYLLLTTLRGLALIAVLMIKVETKISVNVRARRKKPNAVRDIIESLRYIRGSQSLIGILAIATYWNLFISMQGFRATLIPIFAKEILEVGASGYGQLQAAARVGTLVGSLLVANLDRSKRKGWILLIGAEMIGVTLILFPMTRWFPLALILWASVSIMSSIYSNLSQTLLLTESADEMRGRVVGARSQVVAVLPINAIWAGYIAQELGAPIAISVGGILWGLAVLITGLLTPKLRKI
jgi:MFS family permease